jgi:fibro-slime domain-containing protein
MLLRSLALGFLIGVCAGTLAIANTGVALAGGSLTGDYFTIPHSNPDTGRGIDGAVKGLVAARLGPHGFPIATTLARTRKTGSGRITDLNGNGEIMWWSVGRGIRAEKVRQDALPFAFDNFYPDQYGNDSVAYRSVHWKGTFVGPPGGEVTFKLDSDDDAWIFIDGKLAVDNGGVKQPSSTQTTVKGLTNETHRIDVFYLDRYPIHTLMQLDANVDFTP